MEEAAVSENRERNGNAKKKSFIKLLLLIMLVCIFILFCYFQNSRLVTSFYQYKSDKLPADFGGFRIVQISDLHNAVFGKDNELLLRKMEELNPDIIVFTGDMADSNHTDIESLILFAGQAVNIAPVYYVTGNHEYWLSKDNFDRLMSGFNEAGVNVLQNQKVRINLSSIEDNTNEASMEEDDDWAKNDANESKILGMDSEEVTANVSDISDLENDSCDNYIYIELIGLDDRNLDEYTLSPLVDDTALSVVLAHEPQKIDAYAKAKADLVLTGHAHGGQFRFPIIGPVIAPDQGLFPKYTSGEYFLNNTEMIVSRGLGNSVIPVRLFNYPEIVCVDIN